MRTCSRKPPRPLQPETEPYHRHWGGWLGRVLLVTTVSGCAANPPPPFVPLSHDGVQIVHCFDGLPHQSGSKPWLLGGSCCCTPTEEMLKIWQRDGFFQGMTLDDVLAQHDERGIKTGLDHRLCNNQCQYGPHVTKGGHCLAPPTPGTRNYEEVVTGRVAGQTATAAPAAPATGG